MHTDETRSMSSQLGRALNGGMAVALAAIITAWAPISEGASGAAQKADGTPICTYSGFSFDSTSNVLNITCDAVVAGQPGTFSATASPTTVAPNGTANITVIRSGGTTGSYSVAYTGTVTGLTGATLSGTALALGTFSGTVDFANGQGSQTFPFAAGTTEGSLSMSLVGATPTDSSVTTTAAGAVTITVSASTPPPPPGCTTTATYNGTFSQTGQKIVFKLRPGESAAVAYTPTATQTIWKVSTSDTVNTPSNADHEVTISTCPGDFAPVWPCEYQAQYTGATMTTQAAATVPIYACKLVVGTKYYMNVRQVVKGSTGLNSCQLTLGCEVRTQVQVSP